MVLETGTVLDNLYRVIKLLGKGSMGYVYLVERIEDDKKFVVKELFFNEKAGFDLFTAREIFVREAEFMTKFNHQRLPKMYGIFSQNGRAYLTMDYIEGKTLEEIINSSPCPIPEFQAIKWIMDLASILDYLHTSFHRPIIYKDLKPSNIIITPEDTPVLVDFGIARYYNPNKNTDTFNYGTPGYAAPEQYKRRGQSTPQTDVFSLGVILYQMLTKYDPTIKPLIFPPVRNLNPFISTELENIIKKALQLNPVKRYTSIEDFKENLLKYNIYWGNIKYEKFAISIRRMPAEISVKPLKSGINPFIPAIGLIILIYIAVCLFYTQYIIKLLAIPIIIYSILYSRTDFYCKRYKKYGKFGLVSIALLLFIFQCSIFIPVLSKEMVRSYHGGCDSNIKNIVTALEMYSTDNYGAYPSTLDKLMETTSSNRNIYIKSIPVCPASHSPESYGYAVARNPDKFTLWCRVSNWHTTIVGPDGCSHYLSGGLSIGH